MHPGASLREGARPDRRRGRRWPRSTRPPALAATAARLPAARADLAGRADRRRVGRLPGRRHGPGQDDHPDRAAPAPSRRGARRAGPTLVVCPASPAGQLGGGDRIGSRPGSPSAASTARRATWTGSTTGFVLTTYGTMRARPRDAGRGRRGTWWSPTRRSTSRTPRPRPRAALRTIPSRARVALTGTPVENNLTELWAILDWATPGLLGSRNAFRKVWAAPIECGRRARRRRGSSPSWSGRSCCAAASPTPASRPSCPAKTETDHLLGLTREQVVLYEALVRESMERIERADEQTRRGLVLKLLTGLKQICNHPAHYLQPGRRPARRAARRSSTCSTSCSARSSPRTARCWSSPSTSPWPACSSATSPRAGDPAPVPARRHPGARARGDGARASRTARGAGLPALAQGRRHRPQPDPRPTTSIHFDRWWNPAVEDQATDRAYRIGQTRPVQVHRLVTDGHHRGADRRAAHAQARAGRAGARLAARRRSPS